MDEKYFLPNLGIIQALLQTLNEIFQNTKISTMIYSVCVNRSPEANSVTKLGGGGVPSLSQ